MSSPAHTVWKGPLGKVAGGGLLRPRIGIGGISIESSTFSPHTSGDEAFTIRRGEGLLSYYPFLGIGEPLRAAADWVPLIHGRSLPGGAVEPPTYQGMKEALLAGVAEAGPFDGFFFDIHGAMSVIGMDDAEGDLATALRDALGDETLVSAAMDLHGNVSTALFDAVDLITCYRMAPHEDWLNTKQRAVFNLLTQLRSKHGNDPTARRPFKAWVEIPVLLPGEKTSTRLEPAKLIYDRIAEVEQRPGVLDAAVWVGYAWADEPRCHATAIVTGADPDEIACQAEDLASRFWAARDSFEFVGPTATLTEALDVAFAPDAPRPYLISDSGDNPTAGGAGDATWTLAQLLARPELANPNWTVISASIFDEAAVSAAVAAGVGSGVRLQVGGRVSDDIHGAIELAGEVFSITEGDPTAGRQVVIRNGGLYAILTDRRKPFHLLADFQMLGLEPAEADVIVVKIGYLEPELYEVAQGWTLALTPGGVDQDLLRLGHTRLRPGTYPFDQDGADPQLGALVTRGRAPMV